jgi:hypothetical protein
MHVSVKVEKQQPFVGHTGRLGDTVELLESPDHVLEVIKSLGGGTRH